MGVVEVSIKKNQPLFNMIKTYDESVRSALSDFLVDELRQSQKITGHPSRIISELGIGHGAFRIDIVAVNGLMHGYEIKSDADTLARLPEQAEAYSRVFDKLTLVVGERHIIKALSIIPDWWGVKLAKSHADGTILFSDIRTALNNESQDVFSVAQLLWRQEALDILESRNFAYGVKSKRRELIYKRLVSAIGIADLQKSVRDKLFTRQDWRSDQPLLQHGD